MKLILIEVDDDDTADKLIERMKSGPKWRVVGWFQVPRTRCKCTGYHEGGNHRVPNAKKWVRGQLFKWWVHDKCLRPGWGSHTLFNQMPRTDRVFRPNFPETFYNYMEMHDRGFYKDDPA